VPILALCFAGEVDQRDPENYYFRKGREKFAPQALAHYLEAVHVTETLHAICEDNRAAVTPNTQLDEAERGMRKISCPALLLWGLQAKLNEWCDVLAIWREWAEEIQGHSPRPVD
jgi:haloacetate dehalogenase